MVIIEKQDSVILEEVKDFDLGQTLECGQCFHFHKLADNEYVLSAFGHFLHVQQQGDIVTFYRTSREEYECIWKRYFDLERDYGAIKTFLQKKGGKLSEAVDRMQGVRILNQDFFETLISFIVSQNKQIPHIKQIVSMVSKQYGGYLGEAGGVSMYSFPDSRALLTATEEELRALKTGFRAPYICDAVRRVCSGEISEQRLKALSLEDCRTQLMQIKGVGTKVANCVMLFGLGRREAFPVDVWIKRIMEALYFDGQPVQNAKIEQFAAEQFGAYGGYAQQYLFYFGKTVKIGTPSARGASEKAGKAVSGTGKRKNVLNQK